MIKEGILVINKPTGITSHDVVDFVRRKIKIRQVGHAGTLDPLATGVLVILVGKATKLFDKFLNFDKEYLATLTLGTKTTTGDSQGEPILKKSFKDISTEELGSVIQSFIGEQMQIPPMVSALKYKGKRLYSLSRKGGAVELKPRRITIKDLKIIRLELPDIQFYVKCTRGTYVRQLAEDIAQKIDCVGHISQIERLSVGKFNIKDALSLSQIETSRIQPYLA